MNASTPISDDIRELQDKAVTLRMNIPTIYKTLLVKECELERQMIIQTDICVPKQPNNELSKLERIQCQRLPFQNTVQEVHHMLNILDKLFPVNNS